jgi:hypothetical protein
MGRNLHCNEDARAVINFVAALPNNERRHIKPVLTPRLID